MTLVKWLWTGLGVRLFRGRRQRGMGTLGDSSAVLPLRPRPVHFAVRANRGDNTAGLLVQLADEQPSLRHVRRQYR